MRALPLLLALCLALLLRPTLASAQEVDRQQLSLFLSAELQGHFTEIDCRDPKNTKPSILAQQVSAYEELTQQASSRGELPPMALSLGDMIFPGAMGRYLLTENQGDLRALVELVQQIPFEAQAIGNQEFGPNAASLTRYVREARRRDHPVQLANLRCPEGSSKRTLCKMLGTLPGQTPYRIVRRGPLRIALISVLDPRVTEIISSEATEGLSFAEIDDTIEPLVAQIRGKDEADLIFLQVHLASDRNTYRAFQIASRTAGIDLLVTNALAPELRVSPSPGEPSVAGWAVSPQTGTYIVTAGNRDDDVVLAHLSLERGERGSVRRWQIRSLHATRQLVEDYRPNQDTQLATRRIVERFCGDWGRPIRSGLGLAHPLDMESVQKLVLELMRQATSTEVALLNRYAFRSETILPLRDTITYADIYSLLPYSNRVVVLTLKGSELAKLVKKLDERIVHVGVVVQGDAVLINGRPIDESMQYQVAVNQFLAQGGDGILKAETFLAQEVFHPDWSGEEPPLMHELLLHELGQRDEASITSLDPETSFPDLHRAFLWRVIGSLNTSYNRIDVVNPVQNGEAAYGQSQLTVNSTDQINLEGKFDVDADSRDHGVGFDALVQYATARVEDGDESTIETFEETRDLIRLKSAYQYSGIRAALDNKGWVPIPFAEIQLETEFDPPEERGWHKLEGTGILGTRFLVATPLQLKLGVNTRRDFNQPDARTTYGLNAGYALTRIDMLDVFQAPLQFESELEYFYNDITRTNIHELRNTNRLFYALLNELFLTATFNVFAYRDDRVSAWGRNFELQLGLQYIWQGKLQTR